ncbi:prolipoprotein diacylglyceryl transferase [Rhodococcus sp. D2-41]|uniref:Phosphatidylglycerol--prolipoprotein diacylglyceryl transferase n=1 Tax=Speluncibacter jeojiensis TaxID=2710754 RepID=A0A9X4M386_9ACTN|nr:prolipoprotein diacylglyceryl transferase [Rhodococcus sp. D2-41]MDG3012081.1 prolipoprotein diacylglyceryl transferase [Rhodococcus sp. D2-41]MDG3013606.1 prolipoprotein diacylglyceryl transferase [Corynebacteriales bacterium D3-21]
MTDTGAVLALIPSPPQGVWYVGPVAIRAYAICIIIGIIIAIVWGDRRWVARGGEKGTVLDIAIWAVPFGLIGGRLYHLATDWSTYFGAHATATPIDALKIWDGGLGIWGAVLLGGVGAWIGCRVRGLPLPAFGDAIAPCIVLAQAIGRIGNYFNQELYGRPTTMPWGLEIYERIRDGHLDMLGGVSDGMPYSGAPTPVHPTFLYELLWDVGVAIVVVWADRRFRMGHGRTFALYVAGYCLGRFWVELMRSDHATHVFGLRINTITSTVVFLLAVVYLVFARKGREDPDTLKSKQTRALEAEAAQAETAQAQASGTDTPDEKTGKPKGGKPEKPEDGKSDGTAEKDADAVSADKGTSPPR